MMIMSRAWIRFILLRQIIGSLGRARRMSGWRSIWQMGLWRVGRIREIRARNGVILEAGTGEMETGTVGKE